MLPSVLTNYSDRRTDRGRNVRMWGEREIECVRQRVRRKRDIACETESGERE